MFSLAFLFGTAWVPTLFALAAGGFALALWLERRSYCLQIAAVSAQNDGLRATNWQIQSAMRARDRAEAANQAKSRFLADISHDIRTPLSGMIGMADLLGGTKLDGEQATYTAAIRNAGISLGQLVETLLDFSRIEAGRIELAQVEFNVAAAVEAVVELLAPRAQARQLELAALVRPDVPQTIMGDPLRLSQILHNLVGNAVKFTTSGGVGVEVARNEQRLVFHVRDTGPGIDPARRAAIFEPYEQAGTDADGQGSGLGLAITRRLVDEMGGNLSLTHSGPSGSAFTFSIPLVFSTMRPYDQPLARLGIDGKRVLIIANSPFEAPYLFHKLATVGFSVTHANTALEAQAALACASRFDTVLIDRKLGAEIAETLVTSARHAGVAQCLILLSPFERGTFGLASAIGFDGWLTRPVRTLTLLRLIAQAPMPSGPRLVSGEPAANLPPGYRILLAEDNDINALVLTRQCERLGALVTRVADGAAAVKRAVQSPGFDCILMDLRLPIMDGLTAAKAIRASAQPREPSALPLMLAVTASTSAQDRAAALEAGFDDFVSKPVDAAWLSDILRSRAAKTNIEAQLDRAV